MPLRRFAVIALMIAMVCASTPAPAYALSTPSEIQLGKDYDKQITDSSNVVTDPLINRWANEIAAKLWTQAARKDVPYQLKILDVPDINAFSTLGGYEYFNLGLLDFVQSDDELAGVIGHETGHIERRHAVTANNKASIVNLVLGLGSLFSPFLYRFGQLIEAGALAKISRDDETQADKYGLLLMSRAGYDPDAMTSFMAHMSVVLKDSHDLLSRYLADHPDFNNRMAHLVGYPQLDPKVRTDDERLTAALHDQETARYSVAAIKLADYLKRHPGDATAELHLGQVQLALGQNAKSEQNLVEAAGKGSPETRALALVHVKALRDQERRTTLLHPDLEPLRKQLADAQTRETQTVTAVRSRRDPARDQIKGVQSRLQSIVYGMPSWVSRVQPRAGTRLEATLRNLAIMGRSLDTATGKCSEVITGVGSMERNKEGGLLKESSDILGEMAAPLKSEPVPAAALATFPNYPEMLAQLGSVDGDEVRALDAARGALALTDVAAGDLDVFIRQLNRVQADVSGDITVGDYKVLEPLMTTAIDSLNKAAVAGSQASQLYNLARSRQLQVRIDLLGLAASDDRFSTLVRALELRFGKGQIDYAGAARAGLSPGEVASAAIIAADTNSTPQAIAEEARTTHRSIVDVANGRGMLAQSLEIFLGLIYLDYTDDPDKEARGRT